MSGHLIICCSVCMCVHQSLSHVQIFVTPWTIACQAPLSIGFHRQDYWSGFPFHPPGIFPTRDRTCVSYVSCIADRFFTAEPPGRPSDTHKSYYFLSNLSDSEIRTLHCPTEPDLKFQKISHFLLYIRTKATSRVILFRTQV